MSRAIRPGQPRFSATTPEPAALTAEPATPDTTSTATSVASAYTSATPTRTKGHRDCCFDGHRWCCYVEDCPWHTICRREVQRHFKKKHKDLCVTFDVNESVHRSDEEARDWAAKMMGDMQRESVSDLIQVKSGETTLMSSDALLAQFTSPRNLKEAEETRTTSPRKKRAREGDAKIVDKPRSSRSTRTSTPATIETEQPRSNIPVPALTRSVVDSSPTSKRPRLEVSVPQTNINATKCPSTSVTQEAVGDQDLSNDGQFGAAGSEIENEIEYLRTQHIAEAQALKTKHEEEQALLQRKLERSKLTHLVKEANSAIRNAESTLRIAATAMACLSETVKEGSLSQDEALKIVKLHRIPVDLGGSLRRLKNVETDVRTAMGDLQTENLEDVSGDEEM